LIWTLSLLGLFAHPAAAYAAPGDPAPGSPSAAVYELPFEQGRADAEPKGGGTGPVGAGGGDSHYRSENNFGSSSQVPGDPAAGDAGAEDANGGGDRPDDAGAGGADSSSEGTGGEGEAANEWSSVSAAVAVADTGNTSLAATLALLAAIGLVALAVGALAARANRLRSR
jgi:hypothetical protein